jgi:predicted alpha/beta superfamily hydrolase
MKTLRIVFLFVILIITSQANAQEDQIAIMMKEFTKLHVSGSIEERYLPSNETKSTYIIEIYLPPTYTDTQRKYPLLVLTDASLVMGIAESTFNLMTLFQEIPDVIIVGIGYPASSTLDWTRNRFRDMTPTHVEGFDPSGYADNFISFIKKELYPYIENNYRVDTTDRCYFGHSLGGLVGSHILIEHPELFNHYILGSPSYWWDDKEIMKRLSGKNYILSNNIKTIYTYIGGEEDVHVTNWKEFNDILINKLNKSTKFSQKVYEGETHVSVPAAAFSTAIKFVYKK